MRTEASAAAAATETGGDGNAVSNELTGQRAVLLFAEGVAQTRVCPGRLRPLGDGAELHRV
jgi:hypothetical protein